MSHLVDVVIITFDRFYNINEIITDLVEGRPDDWSLHVLFSCGDAKVPPTLRSDLTMTGVGLLIPDAPLSIGKAREYALRNTSGRFVAFLDDDCFPRSSWVPSIVSAVNSQPNVGMIFGPRCEASSRSIGGYIREEEARHSSKINYLLQHSQGALVSGPKALCAGGNMLIRRDALPRSEWLDPGFEGAAFEDVNWQLRLLSEGLSVGLSTGMVVEHRDPLTLPKLLKKSIKSGKGIVRVRNKYGATLGKYSRWGEIWRLLLYPMGTGLLVVTMLSHPVGGILLSLFGILLILQAIGKSTPNIITWLAVKPIRDMAVVIGFVLESLRILRTQWSQKQNEIHQ